MENIEANEISLHRLKVFLFTKDARSWLTNEAIAKGAGVAPRTARHHTKALVELGLFDQADVFPGHRFRLSDKAEVRNKSYFRRLLLSQEVFGL